MCGYLCIDFIDFMLKGKTLTECANLLSPNNFKKNDYIILNYFMGNIFSKMNNFNETPNLTAIPSTQKQFRLNKINEIKHYFLAEIIEKKTNKQRY